MSILTDRVWFFMIRVPILSRLLVITDAPRIDAPLLVTEFVITSNCSEKVSLPLRTTFNGSSVARVNAQAIVALLVIAGHILLICHILTDCCDYRR